MKRPSISKTALCILITILLAAAALLWILLIRRPSGSRVARIYQDGVLLETIDLDTVNEPLEWTVTAAGGGTNTIRAEHGSICVTHASCPDQVCVRTGKISSSLLPIACLPNGLLIRIEESAVPAGLSGVDDIVW